MSLIGASEESYPLLDSIVSIPYRRHWMSKALSDSNLLIALSSFQSILPSVRIEDFLNLSTSIIGDVYSHIESLNGEHIYFLLKLHFARKSDPKSSDRFVGRATKDKIKNASPCIFFPRRHVVDLFRKMSNDK